MPATLAPPDLLKARWEEARTWVAEKFPLWAYEAERMVITQADWTRTAATDGLHLLYNSEFTKLLSPTDIKFVMLHEVMHNALKHHLRLPTEIRNETDAATKKGLFRRWNHAMDSAIHDIIIPMVERGELDATIPTGAISPVYYRELSGMSAEEIYDEIDGLVPGCDCMDQHIFVTLDEDGEITDVTIIGPDGEEIPLPEEMKDTLLKGLIKDKEENLEAWDTGTIVPVERGLDVPPDAREATQPWMAFLAEFISKEAHSDFSWRRPNYRYFGHTGMVYPGLKSEFLRGVILIDNSGSISMKRLRKFGNEIAMIRSILPDHELTILHVDSTVNKVEVVRYGDTMTWEALAGGNNDFEVPFRYIEEQGLQPNFAIYLTDADPAGGPGIPVEPPPYPVLWVVYPLGYGPYAQYKPTPWGTRIEMPKEDRP